MIIRRLIALLAVAFATLDAGQAAAQGAFPGPPPDSSALPSAQTSPFPQGGAAPLSGGGFGPPLNPDPSDACMKEFVPLRDEAEKRGKLIKAASERKAPSDEACKLIAAFGEAEIKMIKYVETNATKCAIPPQIGDQLKAGHRNTEALQQKVCRLAQQRGPHGPVEINDIGDPAMKNLVPIAPR